MATVVEGFDGLEEFLVELGEEFDNIDWTPILNKFLQDLETQHEVYFKSEIDPRGSKWAPLAQSTIARKGHMQILYETGRLRDSLQGRTGDSIREVSSGEGQESFLVFGTSVPYAIYHQDGTARMAQREHVGLNETLGDMFAEQVADAAAKTLAEG